MLSLKLIKFMALVIMLLSVNACSSKNNAPKVAHDPVAIEAGEECHLCGMVISKFSGPKGEVYDRNGKVQKFCSTRDLFSWYLQPENQISTQEIFVHDMVQTPWDKPDDHHLVPAREAWYVMGSDMKGAMGPTLASFKKQVDAKAFMATHGGKLLQFKEVTMDMMTAMNQQRTDNMPRTVPGVYGTPGMNTMPDIKSGTSNMTMPVKGNQKK